MTEPTTAAAPAPAAAPAAPPATIPIGQAPDLATFREARKEGKTEIPNPAVKPEATVEEDPDVKADPELAQEIDEIEKPPAEETPQQKAARTKRLKEAAIKARVTKLARARDAEKAARETAERELEEWRSGRRSAASTEPTPAAKPGDTAPAPTRPKPTRADFPLEKFKDADDPYAAQNDALTEAITDWKIEQREAAAAQSRQRAQAEAQERATQKAMDESLADARTRYADYDAVVGAASFKRTPASEYVLQSIADSGVYGPLTYHLAKNPDRMTAILAMTTPRAVDLALGAEIATVKAALERKEPPPAPPKVTSAAEPVAPVTAAAGTGTASTFNVKSDTGSVEDWRRHRESLTGARS